MDCQDDFASALPARGASSPQITPLRGVKLCLGAACTGCIAHHTIDKGALHHLCLGAACTGCIVRLLQLYARPQTLPRRCLHGVHRGAFFTVPTGAGLCLDAACTGCILPAHHAHGRAQSLCLGAACTGCITPPSRSAIPARFASALPARGASRAAGAQNGQGALPRRCLHGVHPARAPCPRAGTVSLPRRCLHGVHRQKPTNCGTPFCSIRRESVDSFSEINNKDSCADYFPALFCCQGDLHHHYRQPRTDNRPVLRCEQHRLFLFILSSHYRRLL